MLAEAGDVEDFFDNEGSGERDGGRRAETPVPGDNVNAQTMLVAPFDAGVDAAGPENRIKVCQTWLDVGLTAAPADG